MRRDGTGELFRRHGIEIPLRPDDTRALRRALRAARFSSLAPRYEPRGAVSDAFEYRLRHRGHEVVVVDAGTDLPARLRRLVDAAAAVIGG